MSRIFFVLVVSLVLGCSKSSDSPNSNPATPPPAENSGNGSGTIVGNGGDQVALKFTLIGLKSFDYWQQKMSREWKKYSNCAIDLKKTEDPEIPWTEEEWIKLLQESCGNEPNPGPKYFTTINDMLKTTKIFISDAIDCDNKAHCGVSWKSFASDRKVYVSAAKWNLLNDQQKIQESMMAYDSLQSDLRNELLSEQLYSEIFRRVFAVDFSIDVFRNFLDSRSIKIISDGSQSYSQEKMVAQMSMAMDCIKLVEARFPEQMGLTELSLIEEGFYAIGSTIYRHPHNPRENVITYSDYESFATEFYSKYEVRAERRRMVLGQNSSLQKCYNSLVSLGLKNPMIELDLKPLPPQKSGSVKPPMAGDSEQTLEFINIAFKSLEYVVQDQSKTWVKYKACALENPNTIEISCVKPLISEENLIRLSEDFSKIQIEETEQRLCTKAIPNCSDAESLTAINNPEESLIIINRTKWKNTDVATKIKLALHEVFGIIGLEINGYHISSHFAPLIYIEEFNVDFTADEFREFLMKRNIFPLFVGDYYDHLRFQDRAELMMDCLKLVEERFPGRLAVGVVSLSHVSSYDGNGQGIRIEEGELLGLLDLRWDYNRISPRFEHLKKVGQKGLYIDQNTTLQQCYNKVVAVGLK